jgi:hypothetical protein
MPSLYIVLDRKIPGEDVFVNGNSLSKHNDELDRMAKGLGVTPLMNFFSTSKEELASLAGENEASLNVVEKWFAAEDGLRTLNALLQNLAESDLGDKTRLESELREFVGVLELARANGIHWHLAVDY